LNRHFNAQITFENSEIKDCEFTSTFRQMSLDAILTIIESSFPLITINRSGNVILFSGSQCE